MSFIEMQTWSGRHINAWLICPYITATLKKSNQIHHIKYLKWETNVKLWQKESEVKTSPLLDSSEIKQMKHS